MFELIFVMESFDGQLRLSHLAKMIWKTIPVVQEAVKFFFLLQNFNKIHTIHRNTFFL